MYLKLIVFGLGIITLILLATKKNLFKGRSVFNGNWNGTYTGEEDSGAWSVLIGYDGKITGTIISKNKNEYIVFGIIDNKGSFEIRSDGTPAIIFKGIFDNNTALASGEWINESSNPTANGAWSGGKLF